MYSHSLSILACGREPSVRLPGPCRMIRARMPQLLASICCVSPGLQINNWMRASLLHEHYEQPANALNIRHDERCARGPRSDMYRPGTIARNALEEIFIGTIISCREQKVGIRLRR
jgi:hypothetical protein